ncbi:tRNA (guanosine(37)-N1)-methyltransferase TrmD, partial [Acinetobacter baumannii]|nr:tRNA (guanosine(37)-N1)-methyltransferase TrmD [Acinetobacter baumannii]
MCEGVLADESCYMDESHYNGLLEYPHYTRPPVWHGREVPEVLQNGNHAKIDQWRREKSLENTLRKRPDLLRIAPLTEKDKQVLRRLRDKQ